MRIVLACNTMGRGGAEIQVRDYALRLVRRGHRVLVVSMLPFEDFEEELRQGGVETATLDMEKGKASARGFAVLVKLLVAFEPDVVHAHMFAAIFATRLARAAVTPLRLLGRRPPVVIGTAHTPFEAAPRRYQAYRLTEPFSDLWTCVCQEGIDTHERHRAVPSGRGVLTINGIDTRAFRPDPELRARKRSALGLREGDFAWLSVGSFRDEQKDYDNLLRAFARRRAHGSTARLFIAGAGKLLEEKKLVAAKLGLASTEVGFLGLRADVAELMQAADAFVMASAWEALPVVILEAAASGLPCVVTDVGQNRDAVREGAGFVVPPKNDGALADALARVERLSPVERDAFAARAREHAVGTYDIEVVVVDWERRYRELVSGRRPVRADASGASSAQGG